MSRAIPYEDLTYRIIGCAIRVHNTTRRGLREKHYQRALTREMQRIGLIVDEEYFRAVYDEWGFWLGNLYLDHWVNGCVVVEDKAVSRTMQPRDLAQVLAYMTVTEAQVGLFFNFGRSRLEYHRILPPKVVQDWKAHIQPFLHRPPNS